MTDDTLIQEGFYPYQPRHPAPSTFDAHRQQFLAALRVYLADPAIPAADKAAEVEVTVAAIAQIEELSGV